MKIRNYLIAGIVLVATAFIFSCTRKSDDSSEPDPRANEYIVAYVSGSIERDQEIIIRFAKPAVAENLIGSEADQKIFKISPSAEGSLTWQDPTTLIFSPAEKYDWDTEYTVNLSLSEIFGSDVSVKEFNFEVYTLPKNFGVTITGLSISDDKGSEYFLEGSVSTSDVFEISDVETLISASYGDQDMEIEWLHNEEKKHTFFVRGIERTEESGSILISWSGKKIGVDSEDSKSIEVPSLKEFKVTSWRVISTPSQYLLIEFSDKLSTDIELTGMVSIDGNSISKIERSDNVLKVFTGSTLTGTHAIRVDGSISNIFDYNLGEDLNLNADFGGVKPGVRLRGTGVIVPESEGLIFPFEAANLKSVDIRITQIFSNNIHYFLQQNNLDGSYELVFFSRPIKKLRVDLSSDNRMIDYGRWNAFSVDLSNYIDVQPGAIYRVEVGFRKSYSLYPCEEDAEIDKYFLPVEEEGSLPRSSYQEVFWDKYYNWQERDNPCSQAYYDPGKFVTRNILASDFGMIAKRDASGKMNIIVTNLNTARPESDIRVDAYDLQNQQLASVRTDNDGFASFTSDRNAFLLIASRNDEIGYLKTNDGSSLSMSNFDVSGQRSASGTKGFIYGERGVWRPGDSVYVAFILEDKQLWLPDGHPIIFELYDSRGQLTKRMTASKTDRVIYPFWFKTNDDDATGNWNARVRVGGTEFNKRIRIETVKPNRLKINLEFDEDILIGSQNYTGKLNAKWLHGTPAGGMKAKISTTYTEIGTSFENYKDYVFDAPFSDPYFPENTLFESNLDSDGNATVNFKFGTNSTVNEMLRATFITRVFEPGGDFSINRITKKISPFDSYVGFNIPWSNTRYRRLNTEEEHEFKIATVDNNGEPVNGSGISVKVFKLEWRYWWSRSRENLASYSGRTYHKPVYSTKINTSQGEGSFKMEIGKYNWGRYLIVVDLPGGNVAAKVVYFDWAYGRKEGSGGADILNVTTDKEEYSVGEEVKVSFPAGMSSSALVSLENGSTVLRQEWVRDISENSSWTFTAAEDMSPNIYVHVSLLNPHDETANDLPIRMYGIAPILVEDPDSHLEPLISMPDKLRPETEFSVEVSEKEGKEMEYTLSIVDEGLLDLTGFRTPDPWPIFYSKEALGVKTWDMYRYVLGAYGGELERMFAIGGDEAGADPSKSKQKRFEPVVKVLGPFKLAGGKKMKHSITLPQYVGSVRTMVVAANGYAYGNTEKTTPVNNPVMVLGTLPRVLAPGEKIKLPVSVFVMEEGLNKVNVEIETNEMLTPAGPTSMVVDVNEPGEFDIEFDFVVAETTGHAKVDITATSGSEKGRHEIAIEIRNPNPPETRGELRKLEPGEIWDMNMDAFGTKGTNSGKVEVSGMLPLNLEKRLGYLMRYPHGCVEQTTSAVFPQLYLKKLSEIDDDQADFIASNINAAINKLKRFQLSNGSLTFWPGSNYESIWGSVYAAHFLIEAEEAGYAVPSALKSRLLNWLKSNTNSYRYSSSRRYNQVSQSYALYVLALSGEPSLGAMNRLRERGTELEFLARWYLAGAYSLSGRKEVATELTDLRDLTPKRSYYQIYGSIARNKAVVLNVLTLMDEQESAFLVAKELSETLSSQRWMNTQATAWSLMALSEFFGDQKIDDPIKYEVSIDGKKEKYTSTSFINEYLVDNDKEGGADVSLSNQGDKPLYVSASWTGTPLKMSTVDEARGIELKVSYKDKSGSRIDPSILKQGTDFVVEVEIRNMEAARATDLALSQIFPSGWEILNTRLFEGAAIEKNSVYEYKDIRDDRVYTYFSIDPAKTVKFVTNITAAYDGEYTLPATVCEGMYDNTFFAKTAGMLVRVVKE